MSRELMAKEDLNNMGYSEAAQVKIAVEYDKSKERNGYIAGKHMDAPSKWWWQKEQKSWKSWNTVKFRMNTELQRAHDRLKQVVRELTLECSISLNDCGTNEKE